jgi:hypothetical protein
MSSQQLYNEMQLLNLKPHVQVGQLHVFKHRAQDDTSVMGDGVDAVLLHLWGCGLHGADSVGEIDFDVVELRVLEDGLAVRQLDDLVAEGRNNRPIGTPMSVLPQAAMSFSGVVSNAVPTEPRNGTSCAEFFYLLRRADRYRPN